MLVVQCIDTQPNAAEHGEQLFKFISLLGKDQSVYESYTNVRLSQLSYPRMPRHVVINQFEIASNIDLLHLF